MTSTLTSYENLVADLVERIGKARTAHQAVELGYAWVGFSRTRRPGQRKSDVDAILDAVRDRVQETWGFAAYREAPQKAAAA